MKTEQGIRGRIDTMVIIADVIQELCSERTFCTAEAYTTYQNISKCIIYKPYKLYYKYFFRSTNYISMWFDVGFTNNQSAKENYNHQNTNVKNIMNMYVYY